MTDDTIDIFATVRAFSSDAILVTEDGDNEVWLPRSQIKNLAELDLDIDDSAEFIIPVWLAEKEGMV